MKVILVHNQYRLPGGEDVVFEQERELLQRNGHQVVVYERSNHEINENSATDRMVLLKNIIHSEHTEREFSKLLAKEKPELVHVHNTFVMVSPSVYNACVEADVPVLQTLHNYRLLCPAATLYRDGHLCQECMDQGLLKSVQHGCYRESRSTTAAVAMMLTVHRATNTWNRKVDAYVALTEFARQKFVEGGLPADKIFVKPNFVSPDPGMRQSSGDYAICAGRLSPEKGLSTLLTAWERLGNRIPLRILGDGPEREQLERQAKAAGLDKVSFLGHLSRQETWEMIGKARCLIVPSECYETFALTIAEAFACGTPVICSRLGAMQEVVEDGRNGLHFTAGDAEDLAAKVDWAWSHPRELEWMSLEGRREYETKYTAEKNYEMLCGIYESMARSRSSMRAINRQVVSKPVVQFRRAEDLFGKGWSYLTTALQKPSQLLHLPSLFMNGVHVGEYLKLNKGWLKDSGIKTVVDVGAHSGEFSSAIRAVLPNVKVFCFEPLPECHGKLVKKFQNNGVVHVYQTAIGDSRGEVEFFRSDFSKASSLLPMSSLHQDAFPWSARNQVIKVQLAPLDDFEEKIDLSSKTLLKIDVQGFEDRVLRGAERMLQRLDYVLVEVSLAPLYDGQAEFRTIYDMLLRAGFSYKGNVEQLASPVDGAILQVDALFTRDGEAQVPVPQESHLSEVASPV
jgi:FkbM family methyltransferase